MKVPCEKCGSSDGVEVYADHTFCYVCRDREWTDDAGHERPEACDELHQHAGSTSPVIPSGMAQPLKARGIHQDTCEKWGYLCGAEEQIAVYKDPKTRQPVGAKVRKAGKAFHVVGKLPCLYGEWLWPSGGKMLTITEGEIDALSVSQAQGNKYPVVSIPTGSGGAVRALERSYDYVTSFDRINVWFDSDEPGVKAAQAVAEMLPPGKVHIVKSQLKDANEYLKQGKVKEIVDHIWRAELYRPDGIISGREISLDAIRKSCAAGYAIPYPSLQEKLHGLRRRELTLLTAGSGIGKSTLARELAFHLHQKHGLTIGNVYLEESVEKTAQGYVAIANDIPLGVLREEPGCLSSDDWERSLRDVIHDRMYFYDHFGSLDGGNLLARIRYLAVVCRCDFVVLDHISIVTSGLESSSEGERKDIDRLVTGLRSLIEETGVGVIGVVHLRRPSGRTSYNEGGRVTLQDLRGSSGLEQLSDNVIAIERDQQGDNANEAVIRVLKNREFGILGEADTVAYNYDTGRLLPVFGEGF